MQLCQPAAGGQKQGFIIRRSHRVLFAASGCIWAAADEKKKHGRHHHGAAVGLVGFPPAALRLPQVRRTRLQKPRTQDGEGRNAKGGTDGQLSLPAAGGSMVIETKRPNPWFSSPASK